jgi:hypothetical protein
MNLYSIPRSSERRPINVIVRGRVRSRPIFVDLIDISEGGCKIRGGLGFASIGDRVVMKVGGINAPLGVVAWVEGREAGVAFEGEMHSAVLDYLCQAQGLSAASEEWHGRHGD